MVSTRGVKIKFAEGEKVLCYEPDPAKTKVLYDSKVLNIKPSVDKNGKKVLEFLIHFQGWSSSWDRIVTEDLILKDTEENRQLQKSLAERAQLIARGGNLYSRRGGGERKGWRKVVGRGGGTGAEQNGVMSSQQQQSDSDQSDSEDTASLNLILLPLPDSISRALQHDEIAITSQNKVLNLPAEPNIVTILEWFLKDYAKTLMKQVQSCKRQATVPLPGKTSVPTNLTVDSYCRSMNLCREVVDGVRVYTDFTLPQVLLYKQERGQYHTAITVGLQREPSIPGFDPDIKIKEEEEDEEIGECSTKQLTATNVLETHAAAAAISPSYSDQPMERRRSLRSCNQTGPGGTAGAPGSAQQDGSSRTTRRHSADQKSLSTSSTPSHIHNGGGVHIKGEGSGIRPLSQREHEVLDKILSWNLVPDRVKQEKPPSPSIIYGATHLVRVLLKLPEFIQKSDLPDEKVNLIMDFLNNLLKYLEEHPHWFGESQYRTNIYPPPPLSEQPTTNRTAAE